MELELKAILPLMESSNATIYEMNVSLATCSLFMMVKDDTLCLPLYRLISPRLADIGRNKELAGWLDLNLSLNLVPKITGQGGVVF
jgi:hypothetical protein